MFDQWWLDLFSIIFGLGTLAAAILAWRALVATKRQGQEIKKQALQIERNRQKSHERDTLKAVLDIALRDDAINPGRYWKPGMAYLRTLSQATRGTIPLTVRYFNHTWEKELAPEASERNPSKGGTRHYELGSWDWTEKSSILATIYDELIKAITQAAMEASA